METLSFKGNKNRTLIDFTAYKKYEATYTRQMKSEQGEALVLIVEYFRFWTWGLMVKSFLVISRYSAHNDQTDVEILFSWTPKNLFGWRVFRRSVAKDEKRFAGQLKRFVETERTDPHPLQTLPK